MTREEKGHRVVAMRHLGLGTDPNEVTRRNGRTQDLKLGHVGLDSKTAQRHSWRTEPS